MISEELRVDTSGATIVDITDRISAFAGSASVDGLLNVFVPHATAGVAIIETGSGTEADLAVALERLIPHDDIYRHRHGSVGHGADHVLPALVSPSTTVPVRNGRMLLGPWQRIVLIDPNADNPRRVVRLSLLPG